MATALHSTKGYFAVKKETTKGTAATPDVYIPIYDENIVPNLNVDEDNPIIGVNFARYRTLQGMRDFQGSFTAIAEPNTAGYLLDMIMTKGTTTGSDPYTHPFTFGSTTNSYTVDVSKGGKHVIRYLGVELSQIQPGFDSNKMLLNCDTSALGAFIAAEVSSIAGTDPYTITFKTGYDPSPTTGLVVGDLIQLYDVGTDSYINAIVDTIPDATSITVSEDVSAGADGDVVTLRPATPSTTMRDPFLWARTEFRFGATAAAALSATQTRLEPDSNWTIIHEFEDAAGNKSSGEFDPRALTRNQPNAEFTVRQVFDTPDELQDFIALDKKAVVIRHFSEGSDYELRVTFNDIRKTDGAVPSISAGENIYHEFTFLPNYDTSDGQAVDVKVINAVSSI